MAIGATQLVVQEALEMIVWLAASYLSSLTPITIVMSSSLAGAEMITFLAPPAMCAFGRRAGDEAAGGLDHDVHAEVAPGQVGRVALGEDLDRLVADDDGVALDA